MSLTAWLIQIAESTNTPAQPRMTQDFSFHDQFSQDVDKRTV